MQLRIKEVSKSQGISITKLAELVGITQPNMSNIANGKTSPSLELLDRIATALGVTVPEPVRPAADEHDHLPALRNGIGDPRKGIIMEQELILYNSVDGKSRVSLLARDGSVWLNQTQIAELLPPPFPTSAST